MLMKGLAGIAKSRVLSTAEAKSAGNGWLENLVGLVDFGMGLEK